MLRRGRQPLRLTLAVILCLLFQQVAMAAYACAGGMPPAPVAMAQDCTETGMAIAQEAPALCAEHCTPDLPLTPDAGGLHVPALALPPPLFADIAAQAPAAGGHDQAVPIRPPDPPPRLRYCRLLI